MTLSIVIFLVPCVGKVVYTKMELMIVNLLYCKESVSLVPDFLVTQTIIIIDSMKKTANGSIMHELH